MAVKRSAVISPDGQYRYSLVRSWNPLAGRVLWVMCNPSTADGLKDDATIRKCIGFAQRWGYGEIEVVNRAAYRARDPKALLGVDDPIGPENYEHILLGMKRSQFIIFGWGNALDKEIEEHSDLPVWAEVYCLGRNRSGTPRHPLMMPYSTPRVSYE